MFVRFSTRLESASRKPDDAWGDAKQSPPGAGGRAGTTVSARLSVWHHSIGKYVDAMVLFSWSSRLLLTVVLGMIGTSEWPPLPAKHRRAASGLAFRAIR
jgi:hypothetical protein